MYNIESTFDMATLGIAHRNANVWIKITTYDADSRAER